MKNKTLYIIWAALFALCAVLGFFRETVTEGKWLMTLLSVLFFAPPAVLLWRSKKNGDNHTRLLLRNLSGASLAITLVLLVDKDQEDCSTSSNELDSPHKLSSPKCQ